MSKRNKKAMSQTLWENTKRKERQRREREVEERSSILDDLYQFETGQKQNFEFQVGRKSEKSMDSIIDDRLNKVMKREKELAYEIKHPEMIFPRDIIPEKKEKKKNKSKGIGKPKAKGSGDIHITAKIPAPKPAEKPTPLMNQLVEKVNDIPSLTVVSVPELGRVILSDNFIDTTIHMDYLNMDDQIDMNVQLDADQLGEMLSHIYVYIISNKHPAAIYTKEEFTKAFKDVKEIDFDKFIFFNHGDYFFGYYISEENRDIWSGLAREYNLDTIGIIEFYVTMALRSGETHNVFLADDVVYVDNYRKIFAENDAFTHLVTHDEDTVLYTEDEVSDPSDICLRLGIRELNSFKSDVRIILNTLLSEEDEDEDEDIRDWVESDELDYIQETDYSTDEEEAVDEPEEAEEDSEVDIETTDSEDSSESDLDGIETIDLDNLADSMMGKVVQNKKSDGDLIIPVVE